MRAQLKDKLLYGALYTTFFFLAFTISAYFTFPYDRLRDLIIAKVIGDSPGPDSLALNVATLEPHWITGVELTDVDIMRPGEAGGAPATLHFDEVTVRAKLLPLLIGNLRLTLSATAGDGSLRATYAEGDIKEIEAELEDLDVGVVGLGSWIGVPMKGTATGNVAMAFDSKSTNSAGDIALKIQGLHIGDGKSKLKVPGMGDGMTLDEIKAGSLDFVLKVNEGVATLEKFSTTGPDLKLDGSGGLNLTNPLRRSRVTLQLDLKFSDAYKQKSDRTKSLFEIMAMQSEWKRATDPDGTMHLHVTGTVQALRAAPGTGGAGGSTARPARTTAAQRRRARQAATGAAPSILGAPAPAADPSAEPAAPEAEEEP